MLEAAQNNGGTMRRREVLIGAAALAAGPAWAQAPVGNPKVVVETGQGSMMLELYADKAPITAANFLRYVDAKRYDGATIYRVLHTPGDATTGLVQGGAKFDPVHPIAPISHEPTTLTGLAHKDGTISLARRAPGTATSDFFICVGDAPYLDADPKAPGDNLGFAAFGHVVDGMDVVRKILAQPLSPTAGGPDMIGQMLDPAVPIVAAHRTT
jgi:peptidyl-prolyl cis-trans isomerase A (cyclophilin A)